MKYCRSLKFNQKPDYAYIRKIFRELFLIRGHKYDGQFDWVIKFPDLYTILNTSNGPKCLRYSDESEACDENSLEFKDSNFHKRILVEDYESEFPYADLR